MTTSESNPGPLDELFARCLEQPRSERRAAFDAARRDHPEIADEISGRIAALENMGIAVFASAETEAIEFPEELGEFRLLRCLGGGGMGVVYEAEQTSLSRVVALKLIRPEHLFFPGARERFRRETEAVAQLQHPGIVPIYTVGEENGIPYFAMERLRGCTLSDALLELKGRAPESLTGRDLAAPVLRGCRAGAGADGSRLGSFFEMSWTEACIEICRQLAEALEHAHLRHILHRDIKPSNVALTIDGRAMLLDFGLTSSETREPVTRTGSAVGTLPYMSPEQVRGGKRLDHRTDVYSLGVTLYETLTLQLPYAAEDRESTEATIFEGRPDPIRARNRSVPADVETVCLCALDVEPARRYATARAFARDLENVTARRPIAARPAGPGLRARRWIQRNPALTFAIGASIALAIGLPTGLLVQQRSYSDELRDAYQEVQDALATEVVARAEADRERVAAQEARALATIERDRKTRAALTAKQSLRYVQNLFTEASPFETLGDVPDAIEILDRGAERIAVDLEDQPMARSLIRAVIGEIYFDLGRYGDAAPLLEQAVESLRAEGEEARSEYVSTVRVYGSTLAQLGPPQRAEEVLRLALDLAREDGRALQIHEALNALGSFFIGRKQFALAEETIRELLPLIEGVPEARVVLATNLLNLSSAYLGVGRIQEAVERQERALAICREELPEPHPYLATALMMRGQGFRLQGDPDRARALILEGIEMAREIFGDDHVPVAEGKHNLAAILLDSGDLAGAEDLLHQAFGTFRARLGPGSINAVYSGSQLVDVISRQPGREAEVIELLQDLVPHARTALTAEPEKVGMLLALLGGTLSGVGRRDEARPHYEEALEVLGGVPGQEARLVFMRLELGRVCLDAGEFSRAEVFLRDAGETAAAAFGPEHEFTRASRALLEMLERARSGAAAPVEASSLEGSEQAEPGSPR